MKFGLMTDVSAGDAGGAKGFASAQTLQTFGDYICEAEALGFASTFLVEHHFTGNGQVSSSLSVLAYLAGRTSTMRLGTAVVVLPWHNPVLLAEQIATIDQLSHGRFDFGVGKGYRPHEFAGFGIAAEEAPERYEEILSFCKRAWSDRTRFNFEGEYYQFDNVVVDPPARQSPHPPVWVGATSEGSTVKAGRDGHRLLLDQIAAPSLIGLRIRQYKDAAAEAGHVVSPQSVGVNRALRLVDSDDELRQAHRDRAAKLDALGAQAGKKWASFSERDGLPTLATDDVLVDEAALIGYPEDVVDKLKILENEGVDYVLLADFSANQDSLRIFSEKVMPHFSEAAR